MAENGEGFVAHEAFEGAGKAPGLEIWRVEKFEPVKQDPKTAGQFYNGDAYICLKTIGVGNQLSYDLHFWLGKKCSQDESGTAAIRTVELDDHLGGSAVQHRAVQGHESKKFLSYFKKGIKYLDGGVESGFTKVEDGKYTKRLFQCKGKHTCRVEQVEVKCASLNQGDVFILDDGPNLYVWLGPSSSRMERIKGMEIARGMRDDEKAGRALIHVVESDWDSNAAFFNALGSKDRVIRSANKDDEETIRKLDQETLLYRVYETSVGALKREEIKTRPLSQGLLNAKECFVLDSGYSGIYVWTGRDSAVAFRKVVWTAVNEFIDSRGYPNWIQVSRVLDGGETPLFKQYFTDWVDDDEVVAPLPDSGSGSNVADQSYEGVDGSSLHGARPPKAEEYMPDDGKGQLKVYRIDGTELAPVAKEAYGVFFGGDCYVLQYDFVVNDRAQHIIYFWQGLASDINERGASALQAMKLDDDLGGEAVQIRIVMNKEPSHFLKLFNGRMVVFQGGRVLGYRGIHDHDNYDPNEVLMFHIRGDDEDHTRALQVDCRGASLNSNDVFIVETPKKTFVWVGKEAKKAEKEMARFMVQFVAPGRGDPVVIMEGEETNAFWDAIGGEEEYYSGIRKKTTLRTPVRLFHCSNSSGRFTVEEVADFMQEDLDEDDVMMLDTCDEIFVWIGKGANEFEKKESMKTAYTYLTSDPTGRTPDNTLIAVVRQGFEPLQFTGHFHLWDTDKWNNGKTYEELVAELHQENAGVNLLEEEAKKYSATHTLEVLKRRVPPEGVDVIRKEMYLSDEDFQEVFQMTKKEYTEKPEWRRVQMKKDAGLF